MFLRSIAETIESYEFLKRRDSNVRAMRGGREYVLDRTIDPFDNPKDHRTTNNNLPTSDHDALRYLRVVNSLQDHDDEGKDPRGRRVKRFSGHAGVRWSSRRTRRVSFLAGVRILDPKRSSTKYSGYQVMRLATELVPAYSAILGKRHIIGCLNLAGKFSNFC